MQAEHSRDAILRKARSEEVLSSEGVPINASLPIFISESEAKIRTKEEIAYRALSLLIVSVKGEGLDQTVVDGVTKDYGLAEHFTPRERSFIKNPAPTQNARVQFTWRYEAAWTLLWALGYVETLEKPTSICDVARAVTFMKQRTSDKFIADAKPRTMPELLEAADRIYRYHWAVVDARVNGHSAPAGLDSGVTLERHYALNWLVGYMGQEWDDISTDT